MYLLWARAYLVGKNGLGSLICDIIIHMNVRIFLYFSQITPHLNYESSRIYCT